MAGCRTSWVSAVLSHCPTCLTACYPAVRVVLDWSSVRWVFLLRAWQKSQTGPVHTDFQLPSVDSHGCRKAKQALPQPAADRQGAAGLAGCSNTFGHACGSAGGVLRGAGLQEGTHGAGTIQFSPVFAAWSNKDVVSALCVTSWHVPKAVRVYSDKKTSKQFFSFRYQVLLKAESQRWELPDRHTAVFFSSTKHEAKKPFVSFWNSLLTS